MRLTPRLSVDRIAASVDPQVLGGDRGTGAACRRPCAEPGAASPRELRTFTPEQSLGVPDTTVLSHLPDRASSRLGSCARPGIAAEIRRRASERRPRARSQLSSSATLANKPLPLSLPSRPWQSKEGGARRRGAGPLKAPQRMREWLCWSCSLGSTRLPAADCQCARLWRLSAD